MPEERIVERLLSAFSVTLRHQEQVRFGKNPCKTARFSSHPLSFLRRNDEKIRVERATCQLNRRGINDAA